MPIQLKFSPWEKFEQRENLLNSLGANKQCPGIYAIAITSENITGKPFDINNDKIVYFGMTHSQGGLKSRLKQFYNSLQSPQVEPGHGGAYRVKYLENDYETLKDRLFVSILPVDCNVKSLKASDYREMGRIRSLEYEALAQYIEKHDELPEWVRTSIEAARYAPSAVNRQPWGFDVQNSSITVYVRTGSPEFSVSKRLDCGIAMLHIEVAALNCGIRGDWQFLKAPQVARFSALA